MYDVFTNVENLDKEGMALSILNDVTSVETAEHRMMEGERVFLEAEIISVEEEETEFAARIADRYISIQEVRGGYEYSIMSMNYREIYGGVYDDLDISIKEALAIVVQELKEDSFDDGVKGGICVCDELIPIDYGKLMQKVEEAKQEEPYYIYESTIQPEKD